MPVYWKQRYASRNQRHRAWVKQQAAREEALKRSAGPGFWQRLKTRFRRG